MTFYQKSEVVTFNKSQKSKQESLLFIYDFYKESAVIMKSQFFVFIVALTVRKTLYDFFIWFFFQLKKDEFATEDLDLVILLKTVAFIVGKKIQQSKIFLLVFPLK